MRSSKSINLALGILTTIVGSLFFSHSAYAASYINVSSGSGGTINLGSIKPSSSGVSASGSDTLSISTNCSAGYKVYVSGQNGKDTNLTNTNSNVTSNNTISTSSTTIGSTASTLSSNTWGISGNSTDASSGKYVGLPSYSNATSTALITASSADTSSDPSDTSAINTATVYYGVKVDTSLTPGTYTGNVLYTVVVDSNCLEYTLKFDSNNATTSNLVDQTISFGSTVDLSKYSTTSMIKRTGYHLSGWKIKDGDGTLLPTNNNTILDDKVSSSETSPELTLIAQWEPNTYTISYNANAPSGTSVTGTTADQTNQSYGSTITLATNGYTIDGYDFKGWAYQSNATSETLNFTDGQTNVSVSTLATNNASGSVVDTNGATITLYAVWEEAITYMQNWSGCSALAESESVILRDSRDGKDYAVKKLPDGKCWMMQNLTIGMDGAKTLTSADTNIDNGKTYYLPPAGKQGSSTIDDPSTLTATATASFNSSSAHAQTQFRAKDPDIINDSDTGYYDFYSVTLGYSYFYDSVYQGSSTRDICPKGWRLPKTTDSGTNVTTAGLANDFTYLALQYGLTGWSGSETGTSGKEYGNNSDVVMRPMHKSAAFPLSSSMQDNYAGFSYSGSYNYTSALNVGSYGYYWSSSVYDRSSSYSLVFNSVGIYPQRNISKYMGFAVRCVTEPYDGTMQDFKASNFNTAVGASAVLKDTRDGKLYAIKRLPDGKVWMMQNLTVNGIALTADDTNIDNNITYYLPRDGGKGDIASDSTINSADGYNFNASNSNQASFKLRTKDYSITNDADAGYYNFYTATLGYSYYNDSISSGSSTRDICPKNWRLPKVTDNGSSVSSGSPTEFTALVNSYLSTPISGTGNISTSDTNAKNSMYLEAASPLATGTQNTKAGFSYTGYWSGMYTSASSIGQNGYYWTSSVYNTNTSYLLAFNSSSIYPQGSYNKDLGIAVRCVAKS